MKIRHLLILSLLISCKAQPQTAVVERVIDGDTFVTTSGEHIRLADIDAPELGQFYGDSAKAYLERYILHKTVMLNATGKDKYGRTIAYATLYPHKTTVNYCIVRTGHAWVYGAYAGYNMYNTYLYAKKQHLGMWQTSDNLPPFKYRQYERSNY